MLKKFFKVYGWRYIPGLTLLMLNSFVQTLAPSAMGDAIDLLQLKTIPHDRLINQILFILLIALGVFVTRFAWRYYIIGNGRNLEIFMRTEIFRHMQRLPAKYYNHAKTGDLMAYSINDLGAVRMVFGPGISMLLTGLGIGSLSIFSMIGKTDVTLTLATLAPIPIAIGAIFQIGKLVKIRFGKVQELFGQVSGKVQENIMGMRVLKAFAQEGAQVDEFENLSGEMKSANVKLADTSSALNPIVQGLFGLSYMISVVLGGNMVRAGAMTVGDFVAFQGYLAMIMGPILSLSRIVNLFQRGLASVKRLNALMSEPEIDDKEYAVHDGELEMSINAENLTFTYPDGIQPAIKNISFVLPYGHTLGIVGPTGSGKSTIAQLLLKIFVPMDGMLKVSDLDINEVPANAIRDMAGYVPQDGFLFQDTIENNISFFVPDCTHDDVVLAATASGLAGDIGGFEQGYETQAGERGNHLSGGQRQRVAIARALIRKPKLLIMDDSLSAVDMNTEKLILSNLNELDHKCTKVIIAHRLSAVEQADEILYMEDGQIIERGTHTCLLAKNGRYAKMYQKQMNEEGVA